MKANIIPVFLPATLNDRKHWIVKWRIILQDIIGT